MTGEPIPDRGDRLARRYVAWVARHARAVVIAHLVVFAIALDLVAFHLPLHADLTDLLPADAPAVVDMHRIAARVAANDTVLVVVEAHDPATCTAITAELGAALRALPPALVVRVDGDQADARAFLWDHRFVLAPLAELARARDALRHRISSRVLATNPLFIDLDDTGSEADAARRAEAERMSKQELADLRARRDDVDRTLHRPSNVSADGLRALLEVRTTAAATDIDLGRRVLDALALARTRVLAAHPQSRADIGFAGDLVTSLAEHDAIEQGTLISSIATTLLVALVLALYFRSLRLLGMLVGVLAIATVIAFGIAALTVGHLNAATAFLGAIIAGNGVNYGILLIARFLEERGTREVEPALARAIARTLRPTAVASLGAAIAYAALAATTFAGFSEFAIIGTVGMIVCWLATYGLLPALLVTRARRVDAVVTERWLERALVRAAGVRRPRVTLALAALVLGLAGALAAQFLSHDPFEYDLRELGSVGSAAETERHWMQIADAAFGRGRAGRTYIAVDRDEDVAPVVAALAEPERARVVGSVESLLSVVPADQPARLAVLADIRTLIDDPALAALDDDERAELAALRPPDALAPIERTDLPPSIVSALTDRQGNLGRLISVRPARGTDELDGHAMLRFAAAVRRIDLPDRRVVTTSGAGVVFTDILATIVRDGPRVALLALAGVVVMVLVVVGPNRRGVVTLAATTAGAIAMIAACAALGLRVSFLDFVALPVTLGLGVDYAINVAARADDTRDPIAMLRTSGATVFVCSLTTMIGYASLFASDNLAIRGFGRASLIGEVAAVAAALVLVPALLAPRRHR